MRLLGLHGSALYSVDHPIHTPYESWNMYYYARPYQFRQSELTAQDVDMGLQLRNAISATYDRLRETNRPRMGNVDGLEYATLPQ